MEFHNVKLLPKGLPEIMAQLVPYDIYPDTKVIAYSRKWMGPYGGHCLGYAGYHSLTDSFYIGLYPTMCCSNGGHGRGYPGTFSFQLWMGMLSTALHEIGHLVTRQLYCDLFYSNHSYDGTYWYVESLANDWMNDAMARILQVDPRLGQPPGALTGYPGILAYELRNNGGKPWDGFNPHRMAEWHGLRCGGQVTPGSVAKHAIFNLLGAERFWDLDDQSRTRLERMARGQVHRAANNLGIRRCAFSATGRRYLMFNAGEAEAVYEWVVDNRGRLVDAYRMLKLQQEVPKHWKWELVDSNWELVGIDTPVEAPPEQMRLPL